MTNSIIIFKLFLCICNKILLGQNIQNNTGTLQDKQLNEYEREGLLRQYKWLKCMVIRQMAYSTTVYQTKAEAYLLYEGQSVTFDSWLCLLPHQIEEIKVRWKFIAVDGAAVTFLEENGDKFFVHGDSKNLEITDVKKEDTGFYFANVDYDHDSAAYFLEVSNMDEIQTVIHLSYDSKYEPPEHILEDKNLLVSLKLSEWTPCSRCDHIGIRHRSGTCFVEPYKDEPIKPIHYPAFDLFLGGLPCRSEFLPQEIKQLHRVNSTQSIYMKSFCKLPCPTTPPREMGKFRENIKGAPRRFFKMIKPTFPTIVGRKVIFQQKNKGAIIKCPRRNKTVLVPKVVQIFTKGRMIIDFTGRIRIRHLRLQDGGEYSCWQGNKLIGMVELIVQDRFVMPQHVEALLPLLSYVFVLLAVLFFGCKLIVKRKRSRATS